jgi:hypothetical protein
MFLCFLEHTEIREREFANVKTRARLGRRSDRSVGLVVIMPASAQALTGQKGKKNGCQSCQARRCACRVVQYRTVIQGELF